MPNTINTGDNEGGAVLNSKGSQIYFTRCPREKKENIGCDIFFADKQGTNWKQAVKIVLKPEGTIISFINYIYHPINPSRF